MIQLTLYGTLGCHLCEDAEWLIRQAIAESPQRIELTAVDIADDAGLAERYGVRIPVLRDRTTDAELAWPFDLPEVMAFLEELPSGI